MERGGCRAGRGQRHFGLGRKTVINDEKKWLGVKIICCFVYLCWDYARRQIQNSNHQFQHSQSIWWCFVLKERWRANCKVSAWRPRTQIFPQAHYIKLIWWNNFLLWEAVYSELSPLAFSRLLIQFHSKSADLPKIFPLGWWIPPKRDRALWSRNHNRYVDELDE